MTSPAESGRASLWVQRLAAARSRIRSAPPLVVEGRLTRMVGLTLEP